MSTESNQQQRGISVSLDELISMRLRAHRLERFARRVSGSHAAVHVSRFRGRGVDYAESRGYQPGDDIRQMDWRVTARTGRPHTKMFEEERERSVLLVLNCNPSMRFGTRVRFKSVQAARTAALIAWATALAGDRIGAVGYGPGLNAEVKPAGGMRGALRCLRAFVEWDAITREAQSTIPLSQALQRAQRLARPGTQIIVLGDGFDCDEAAAPALALLAEHCDVAGVVLSDPLEHRPPSPARYAVQSAGGRILLDLSAKDTRARWPRAFDERREAFTGMFKRRALSCTVLDTADEPEAVLRVVLGFDARRRKAG